MKQPVFVDEGIALVILILQSLRLQGASKQDIAAWMKELNNWIFEDCVESGVMYTAFLVWRPTLRALFEWLALKYVGKPLYRLQDDDILQFNACLKSLERDLSEFVGKPVSLTGAFQKLLKK